jgi:hypothetical protein
MVRRSMTDAPKPTRLPAALLALVLLLLSGFGVQAAAPVLTLPSAVTILEDQATNLVFSFTDDDTNDYFSVVITASSSDQTLIPNANLALSPGLTTRTLSITPALHKFGTATITLIATDGAGERATNTFTLNVTFTNYPPTFSTVVANRIIREDAGATNLTFVLSDVETPASNLTVTATSTNTTLVPNGNLTLGGTTGNRTLTLNSVTNLSGLTAVSLIVTDGGGAKATNTFLLTVLSVNDAPTFSISTNRIDQAEDAGLTTVSNFLTSISSGPSNESSQSNWLVFNYTTNFFVQEPAIDGSGTLTFQVATNSNGTNSITFILADDGGTANLGKDRSTNTLTLAVASVNDLPLITTNISALAVREDAGRTNLSYSIFDADHALTALTITATSTNTSLVPTNGFTFTGTSSNRTVGVTPLTNAFGVTEISLVVTDSAGGAATNKFVLTVSSVADAPILGGTTNRTFLEDATTNLSGVISLYDADTAITNVGVTVTSSDTNIVGVAFSATNNVTATNLSLTLDYTLKTNANGVATIAVVATDGAVSTTNSFTVTVTAVNDLPSYTLSTNLVLIAEDAGAITNANFLTSISTGPANETNQTHVFTVTSEANFAYATAPAINAGGSLTFRAATNAVGTNLITVVMKDNGGVTGGGKDSVTNTFNIAVTAVNDAAYFTGITSKSILEDATTNNTAVVNVIDPDTANTNVSVTVSSSDTNLVTVALTATNSIGTTNSALTLTFTPVTNAYGSATITLIANDGAAGTTNSLVLTVTAVNDLPAFTVSTNLVLVAEDAGPITNASFLTGISTGPGNETNQTYAFTLTSGTNFSFATAPAISTNGTLTFRTATNAVGTNLITVVMKDNGGVTGGGKDSVTNTFSIGVTPANDAPTFLGIAAKTILEDSTTNTAVINAIDTDTASSNLVVTVSSSDTNLVTVALTSTNLVSGTNAALTLGFTTVTNAYGSATITAIVSDGTLSTTNTFALTVTAVNDLPAFTVSTNLVLVAEDAGIVTNASFLTGISTGPGNETNQTYTFTLTSGTNFSFATAPAIATNGTLTFRVATNAVGTNLITVVLKDSGGTTGGGKDSVTNTFSIGVTPANDAPTFLGIAAKTILEDSTTNTAVINAIDSDTASSNLVVTATSSDTNLVRVALTSTNLISGTNAALTLAFTPVTNANGSATITLIANDGALSTTNSFALTVTAVNDLPAFTVSTNLVLVAEDAGTITNASFLTGLSTGPTNEAAQTYTFTLTSGTNFTFATAPTISTNGTLTFRVATNAVGTNLITVVMKDSGGVTGGGKDSVTNTFSIGVTPANDAPYFTGLVAKTILEDISTNSMVVNVIDTDTANTSVSVTAASSDTNLVAVSISATNAIGTTNSALTLSFAPLTNAYGSATITLVANDGALNTTNTFTLTVSAVNDLPGFTVSTNLVLVAEDAGSITNASFLTGISTGPGNETNQTWTFTVTSGTNFSFATAPAIGTNGSLTFRTATNAVGTNLITVVMKDSGGTTGGGKDSVTNTFSIGVTPLNDAPVLAGILSKTILEDTTTNTMVINAIDTDTASSNLVVTVTSSDTNLATVAITATNILNGTNAAFTLGFTPLTNANGSLSVTVVANDGALSRTNSFLLTVTAVNDLPAFTVSTNLVLVAEDAGIVTNASFLTGISTGPTNESSQKWTFTLTSGTNFNFATAPAISTNGTLTFRTATNVFGTNLITVVMKDTGGTTGGGKDSVTNTFSIGVTPANDAPIFAGLVSKTILEDATTNTAVIAVIDTDTASSNLVVTASSSDTNIATVAITSTNLVSGTNATYTLAFSPKTNANGSLSISLVANDGALSTTNSFLLTVSAVNDLPSFTVSTNLVLVAEDAGTITNASFLTAISAGPTNEVNQKWTFTLTAGTNFSFATAPTITTNGTLTFRTATNAVGTNLITVVMKDSGGATGGGKDSVTNTFSIGVSSANDAPYFVGLSSRTILEDATTNTAVITVIDTDTASSNVVVTVSVSDTNIATVAITSTNLVSSTNAAYTLGFTPLTNANGSLSVTLVANDGALSRTNSFLLTVTAVNDLPAFTVSTNLVLVAEDAGLVTNANFLTGISAGPTNEASQVYTFTLTAGTNFSFATAPAISTNGTLTFRAATNAVGTNLITVVLKDKGGTTGGGKDSVTNTFNIGVTPANDAPYFTGLLGKTILEDVSTNTMVVNVIDTDTASSNVVVTVSSSDTNLVTVALTATNAINSANAALTLAFMPQTNANGSATITLIANDGALSQTNSFAVNVTAVNDLPAFTVSTNLVLNAEDAGSITNANFLTGISAGPTNEAAQKWTFTLTSGTNFSFATAPAISTNGTLTFRVATNAVGTNLITVVMKDTGGTTGGGRDAVTNTFSIGVTPVNDAPYFLKTVSRTILEDVTTNTAVITVIDTDSANSNLVLTVTSSDTNLVTVTITATNAVSATNLAYTLAFTPQTNAFGSVGVTLVAGDGALNSTNSFLLTVTGVNDQPAFTLSTNLLLVAEDAGFVTNANFLTGISAGPTNESSQKWTFTVTSGTNFGYLLKPSISTNGTLVFQTAPNAVGTNLLTVVLKDSGGVTGGGKDSVTNTFSLAVTAQNDAPSFAGVVSRTIREDATSTNTAVISVFDTDSALTNVTLTVSSSDTNIATVAITATNIVSATNAAYTLTFTPVTNLYGSLSITLVANDGANSATNSFLLTVSSINDAPSFTLSTNLVLIAEDAGAITNTSFLTDLSVGPTNEANQKWTFTVKAGTNFTFATAPAISTNGTLIFKVATNAVGTNVLTVVMKDTGGTVNGGKDSVTNTFSLAVTPVNDPVYFTGIATKTILEDATTNVTSTLNLIDVDTASTNVTVTVASSDTNLATVAITTTNVLSGTNTQIVLTYAPKTNANGSATITLIADDGSLTTTNSFLLNVTAVNDVPSFNLALSSYTVDKFNVVVSITNAVTNIFRGALNESNQIVSFLMSNNNTTLFTAQPAIGTNGILTFTPAAKGGTATVTVRAKDNGGVAGGGVDTAAGQTFTITVPPNPFVALGGAYAGLFFDTNTMANDNSGYFKLTLATNGTFTGHILRVGTSNVFSGQFSPASPTLALAVSNTPCVLNLTLDTSANWTETISGSVSNTTAGWSVQLLSYLNVNAGGFPAALAGEYLVAIPGNASASVGAPGDGTLAVTIANNGVTTLSGYLADDTFVSQTTHLSRSGNVPFYAAVGTTGSASGWLTFKAGGTSQLQNDSEVVYIRGAGGSYYPAGFTNATVAIGSIYDDTAIDLLNVSSGSVVLSGGGLGSTITTSYTLANNVITIDPSATNGLALTIFRNTGQVSGTFTSGGQTAEINSVILQSTNVARGYFVLPGGVGKFILY